MREILSEILEQHLCQIPDDKRDNSHKYYYRNFEDNLIYPMDKKHIVEYGNADGGEMKAKGKNPAKMASIASSSAMTFNILGNTSIVAKPGQLFASGCYDITYEKQLCTLNTGRSPANLDAFLANTSAGEAIFCEMKMMEWLGAPGVLKEAYFNREHYFDPTAYDDVFSNIVSALRKSAIPNEQKAYKSVFKKYDAWQMFKHTLAIYNATSRTTKDSINKKTGSMEGLFKKVTLANVVFEIDISLIKDDILREKYCRALEKEHEEAQQFIDTMLSVKHGLVKLFKDNCNIEFDIRYIPVSEFVSQFEKSESELNFLKRYCCR